MFNVVLFSQHILLNSPSYRSIPPRPIIADPYLFPLYRWLVEYIMREPHIHQENISISNLKEGSIRI